MLNVQTSGPTLKSTLQSKRSCSCSIKGWENLRQLIKIIELRYLVTRIVTVAICYLKIHGWYSVIGKTPQLNTANLANTMTWQNICNHSGLKLRFTKTAEFLHNVSWRLYHTSLIALQQIKKPATSNEFSPDVFLHLNCIRNGVKGSSCALISLMYLLHPNL